MPKVRVKMKERNRIVTSTPQERLRSLERRQEGFLALLEHLEDRLDEITRSHTGPAPDPAPDPTPEATRADADSPDDYPVTPSTLAVKPPYLQRLIHSLEFTAVQHDRLCAALCGYRAIRIRPNVRDGVPYLCIDVEHPDLPSCWVTVLRLSRDTLFEQYNLITPAGILEAMGDWVSRNL